MALLQVNFFSKVLGKATQLQVIIPESSDREFKLLDPTVKYKTLYLLHGGTDDSTAWIRQTAIERYAREYNMAVVMPDADLSYYSDMVQGRKYWTFICEEVPNFVQAYFPLSDKREDNFVAGLSMGGYGSFKMAVYKPTQFAAAASFSGTLCVDDLIDYVPHRRKEFHEIWGNLDTIKGSENDLKYLYQNAINGGIKLPRLYQFCGTEDFLYKMNVDFKNTIEKMGIELHYEEATGTHDWAYWEDCIQKTFKLFTGELNHETK